MSNYQLSGIFLERIFRKFIWR